jgi:hypothetical protein
MTMSVIDAFEGSFLILNFTHSIAPCPIKAVTGHLEYWSGTRRSDNVISVKSDAMIVTGTDMPAFLRFCVFVLLFLLAPVCLAQEVAVRLINAVNGRPLQDQPVSVSFLYDRKYDKSIPKYDRVLHLETDVNGEAHFRLPEPPPTQFSAQASLDWSRWNCGCGILGSTDDLIGKGIVANSPTSAAVPGQLLFVTRPLSFFERLIYQVMKE